jgi:ribonuclease T1
VGRRTSAPLTARWIPRSTARALLALLLGTFSLALALSLGASRAEAHSHHHSSAVAESDGGASITDPVERAEIRKMLDRIAAKGPFRHRQDGVVFGNREGRLPAQARGFYHEYTVETPGASDRGARRIIRGQGGETYYTHDHYRTFVRLDPETFR